MQKTFLTFLGVAFCSLLAHADQGAYFNWGQGLDGWGHCYEYTNSGAVLNDGRPVDDNMCGGITFNWAQGLDGWGHC